MAFVTARNTITGKVVKIPEHYLGHPVLGKNFVPADRGDKDYEPELYAPKSAHEFNDTRNSRKKEAIVPETVIEEIIIEEVNTDGA